VEEVNKMDDQFQVKVIGVDQQGKIDLSKKELTPRPNRDQKDNNNRYRNRPSYK